MKTFNTHIEAARYLLEKPEVHKVMADDDDTIIHTDEYGDFRDEDNIHIGLYNYYPPFTSVEPEKSNAEIAEEIVEHYKDKEDLDLIIECVLDIMDEKIKKAVAK